MAKRNAIVNAEGGSVDEVGFPDKWLKKIPDWKEVADAMDENQLKKAIVDCEGNIYVIEKEKSADVKLKAAKEIVKDHSAPYNEAKAVQTAKIKYALYLLENKGVNLDSTDSGE
jgi:hypothetical protein